MLPEQIFSEDTIVQGKCCSYSSLIVWGIHTIVLRTVLYFQTAVKINTGFLSLVLSHYAHPHCFDEGSVLYNFSHTFGRAFAELPINMVILAFRFCRKHVDFVL